jgi:hypothetical protein
MEPSTSEVFVPRPTDEEEIPARVDFPEEEIPAWMDFPAEVAGENDRGDQERTRRAMCIAWMVARKEISKSRLHTIPAEVVRSRISVSFPLNCSCV